MSRKPLRARRSMLGSIKSGYEGPLEIDGRKVGRGEFRRAWLAQFGHREHRGAPIARSRSVRARKAAVLARRPLIGCDHEFEFHQDVQGDYVYTQTIQWLQCANCGAERSATWEDAPSYDDY